jgi:uncharacterized protein
VLHERSCEGTLTHVRRRPVAHRFRYRIWLAWLDLETFARPRGPGLLWSTRWPALIRLRADDYLPLPAGAADRCAALSLRDRLRLHLSAHGLSHAADGRVFVLTQPRSWGVAFNPVTFYFCFDDAGRLLVLAAEVTNTPWGERFVYVMPTESNRPGSPLSSQRFRMTIDKAFHVSPFMSMALQYRWDVRLTERTLRIDMQLHDAHEAIFGATLALRCRPLTSAAATSAALRFPAQNLRNLARIYWQAFQLWRRGAPQYPHPVTRTTA